MDLQRYSLKLFLRDPAAVRPAEMIPVFHGWIQRGAVEGLPLDVADYGHVHHGPGVMLIGHEADHALDLGEGRPGLVYARKRDGEGSLAERLREALRLLLAAAQEMESEPSLAGRATLRTDELLVTISDRLAAPNGQESLEALGAAIEEALASAYGDLPLELGLADEDPRAPLGVRVLAAEAPALSELLDRLGSVAPTA